VLFLDLVARLFDHLQLLRTALLWRKLLQQWLVAVDRSDAVLQLHQSTRSLAVVVVGTKAEGRVGAFVAVIWALGRLRLGQPASHTLEGNECLQLWTLREAKQETP